jgi:TRAP-type C4-dicarboxylate transport system permease small subunit
VESAYAAWRAFQEKFLAHAAALVLIGTTLLALVEVVRRYVFGFSYEWQQDAVTFFTLSAVYLFFGVSQRRGQHLTVSILTDSLDALGPRARRAADWIRLIALVFSFVFLVAVVWWGLPEVRDAFEFESRTESLAFPMAPFLVALMLGFAFMAVSVFFQIYRDIHKLRGRSVLVEPAEPEEKLH